MKKLGFTIVLIVACVFAQAQTIEHTYHFGQPRVQQTGEYQTLSFENSVSNGTIGEQFLLNHSS